MYVSESINIHIKMPKMCQAKETAKIKHEKEKLNTLCMKNTE